MKGWRPSPAMGRPAKNMRARSRSCWVSAGRFSAPSLPRSRASVSRASSSKRMLLDRKAEVIRGDLFQLVGLVEDHGGGLGQNAGVGRAGGLAA